MKQMSFDALLKPAYKITKPIRLIELFAGIGAQAKALERLGVPFEHYQICEFDKYAVKSYNAIHHTNFETSDITKLKGSDLGIVDKDKYEYIMTYSFPCQDISIAGNQKGYSKGSGTRSGLLWQVERLLKECEHLPQILLMENVKQVVSDKNKSDFNEWCKFLESKGYSNYWKILNAKDFDIPQNRERCFMVSILGNYYYEFPKGFPLTKRLKDILEDNVDEKYYLNEKQIQYKLTTDYIKSDFEHSVNNPNGICKYSLCARDYKDPKCVMNINPSRNGMNGNVWSTDNVSPTLTTNKGEGIKIIGNLEGGKWDNINESCRRVYNTEGISPCVTACSGGNHEVKIAEPLALDEQNNYIRNDGCVGTLTTDGSSPKHNNRIVEPNLNIRKLTPLECFRLMDFDDTDYDAASKVNSNSQLYKQAGNSICVGVLCAIFKELI